MDDVFDEEADDSVIAAIEWTRLKANRLKDGFRDGVEKSRDFKLQEGFDQGFKQGVNLSCRFGKMRGTLSSILVLHIKPNNKFNISSEQLVMSVEDLLSEIADVERLLPSEVKAMASTSSSTDDGSNGGLSNSLATRSGSDSWTSVNVDMDTVVAELETKVAAIIEQLRLDS